MLYYALQTEQDLTWDCSVRVSQSQIQALNSHTVVIEDSKLVRRVINPPRHRIDVDLTYLLKTFCYEYSLWAQLTYIYKYTYAIR